jgi:hypothetical protein
MGRGSACVGREDGVNSREVSKYGVELIFAFKLAFALDTPYPYRAVSFPKQLILFEFQRIYIL